MVVEHQRFGCEAETALDQGDHLQHGLALRTAQLVVAQIEIAHGLEHERPRHAGPRLCPTALAGAVFQLRPVQTWPSGSMVRCWAMSEKPRSCVWKRHMATIESWPRHCAWLGRRVVHVDAGDASTEVERPEDRGELVHAETLEWCWHVQVPPDWMATPGRVARTPVPSQVLN